MYFILFIHSMHIIMSAVTFSHINYGGPEGHLSLQWQSLQYQSCITPVNCDATRTMYHSGNSAMTHAK